MQASFQDLGILNAGAIYKGLLADPYHSFDQGFKSTLEQPELIALCQRISDWCDNKEISIK